jgi:RNA ligase (TIGR02306 family)
MGKGILAGSKGDRVKAIKLRGILSQGLIFPCVKNGDHFAIKNSYGKFTEVTLGDNVTDLLNIRKYEPEIPSSMAGDVVNIGSHNTIKYDIENLKKYSFVLEENEDDEKFYITEKLHGSFCMVGCVREINTTDLIFNNTFVSSKGMGTQGLVMKMNERNIDTNIYTKVAITEGLFNKVHDYVYEHKDCKKLIICGEVFGKGVQDLAYGMEKPTFRAFDVFYNDNYMDANKKYEFLAKLGIDCVPIFATMTYDRVKFDELAKGITSFEGCDNVKEGIVITPAVERKHPTLGRVILKHINDAYLTRKGNVTEYS